MRFRRALPASVLAACFFASTASLAEGKAQEKKAEEKKSEPQKSEGAPVEKPRIRLKWSTSTEVDNYGFLVHRTEKEGAEPETFPVVTPKVIPGAGNSEVPQSYTWDDHDVVMGTTYYYWLESISTQGVKEKFSPVLARKCCKVPGAEPAKADEKPQKDAAKPN